MKTNTTNLLRQLRAASPYASRRYLWEVVRDGDRRNWSTSISRLPSGPFTLTVAIAENVGVFGYPQWDAYTDVEITVDGTTATLTEDGRNLTTIALF